MEPETNVGETGAPENESPSSEKPTTALTVEAIRDALLPDITAMVGQQVQAANAAVYRGLQGLMDAKLSEIREQFGVDRETAIAMKEAAKMQLGDEAFTAVTQRAQSETDVAKLRRELEALKASQQTPQDSEPAAAKEWRQIHLPELMEYVDELDVKFEDVRKRMGSKTVESYRDGFLGWKREFRKHANAMADEKRRQDTETKVQIDTTRGTAVGTKDYSNVPISSIPDADFVKDFNSIAAAVVAKNRR